jgi:two-component system chemotaxis sensor kinase CheA
LSDGEKITDSELFNLVFEAGFSTAEEVTDLSGRGVVIDVVRRNIELLRGNIEIQSTEGQGSTITIRLFPGRLPSRLERTRSA